MRPATEFHSIMERLGARPEEPNRLSLVNNHRRELPRELSVNPRFELALPSVNTRTLKIQKSSHKQAQMAQAEILAGSREGSRPERQTGLKARNVTAWGEASGTSAAPGNWAIYFPLRTKAADHFITSPTEGPTAALTALFPFQPSTPSPTLFPTSCLRNVI